MRFFSVFLLSLIITACSTDNIFSTVGRSAGGAISTVVMGKDYGAASAVLGNLGAGADRALANPLNQLTKLDWENVSTSLENYPDGSPHRWFNPETGRQGTAIPHDTFVGDGRTCRRNTVQIFETGKPELRIEILGCRAKRGGGWEFPKV